MEITIFLIGTRKLHSDKKQKDYYVVDYVKNDVPCTDYIELSEFNRISSKNKNYQKCIGVFSLNSFNRGYLCDVK